MKKKYLIGIILLFLFGLLYFILSENKTGYTVETYQIETKKGWGYLLKKDGKNVIKQYRIPAIQKNYTFPSKESAEKTGELVLKKIRMKEMPTISPEELIKIGVIDSLHHPIP